MDRDTNKIAKKKYAKKRKSTKQKKHHDSSGEESIDLSEKIFPIAHYISDREEMIRQVFSVMEKEKLNCMLPPILKGMTIGVLQEKCLKELVKMSDEEVQKVLCGENIEGLRKKVTAPLVEIDSDSCQSLSSIEECNNTEKEKRTLLDILEQEMQEIAYNTVLKKADKPDTESDDGLPEVVAITPPHSPSKVADNVPLICIDSGDDEPDMASCDPQLGNISNQMGNHNLVPESNPHMPKIQTAVTNKETLAGNKNLTCVIDRSSASASPSIANDSSSVHLAKRNNSQESFTIQIFSKHTSSERVVKKVLKPLSSDLDLEKNAIVNSEETKTVSSDLGNGLSDCVENACIGQSGQIVVETEAVVPANEVEEIQIVEEHISLQQSSTQETQFSDTSILQLVDSCISLEDSKTAGTEAPIENKVEEKEEGELSEEESREETLESHEEEPQISTIFLSSDDSDAKSDLEKQDHKYKVRRHHHRSKGNKKNTVSPERTRRHIEKRGNRSYRRKTTTLVKEIQSHSEKVKEMIPENATSSNNSHISDELEMNTTSEETASTLPDSVPVLEEKEAKICDPPTSPNTLEIHISDTKLDSSEETESTEPVSTKTSWADRWAEKKDLKKVVITSKICQNVRKRILSARRKQANAEPTIPQTVALPPVPPLVLHVEGSVQEYEMLQVLDNEDKNDLDVDHSVCNTSQDLESTKSNLDENHEEKQ